MAVYKRGYERYQGELEGRRQRFLVLPRYAFRQMFRQRLTILILIAALIYPLFCAAFIYLVNGVDLLNQFGTSLQGFLTIDGKSFMYFIKVQSVFAIFLAALTGPGLISPDLTNNALPLYFSRPLSRTDYVVGRLTAPAALLSLITWVPGLLLFLFQAAVAEGTWGMDNWRIGVGMFVGFWLWICFCSLVALVSSAYVKMRAIAGGLVLGFFFILSGISTMINGVFRGTWGSLLNPAWITQRLCHAMMGTEAPPGSGVAASILALMVFFLLLIFVLERKLRPVEVVS